MLSVINHIPVKPEHGPAFEAAFRANLRHMDGVDGFVGVDIWRPSPTAKPGTYPANAYMIQTRWRDEAAFRAWVGSASFRKSHANPMPDAWRDGEAFMSQHELAIASE